MAGLGAAPVVPAGLVSLKGKLGVFGIYNGYAHLKVTAYIEAVVEGKSFPGGICDGNLCVVIALVLCGNLKAEGAIRADFDLSFKHFVTPAGYAEPCLGPAEAVAGIGAHLAAHGDGGANKIEFRALVKAYVKGREHEFVYAEVIPFQGFGAVHDFHGEHAVPEAGGNSEVSAGRAKVSGFYFLCIQEVMLGVKEFHLQFSAFEGLQLEHGVSFVHHNLEAEDVSGVVGAAVTVNVAFYGVVRDVDGGLANNAHGAGLAVSAHCNKGIIGSGVCLYLLVYGRR